MGNEVELNVVILPEEKIRDVAVDISRKIRETHPTDFVLDGKTKIPHMTVYQARYPERNVDAVRAYLKTVAARTSPFEVALGKFSNWSGYIFWDAEATNEMTHLVKSVVYQLNPMREGLVRKGVQTGKWDMQQTYEIQNYGTLMVGGSLPPHVTVSKTTNERDGQTVVRELRPRIAKFVAAKIFLGTNGEHGTLTEILEEFPFGGGSPYMLRSQNYF